MAATTEPKPISAGHAVICLETQSSGPHMREDRGSPNTDFQTWDPKPAFRNGDGKEAFGT